MIKPDSQFTIELVFRKKLTLVLGSLDPSYSLFRTNNIITLYNMIITKYNIKSDN